MNLIRDAFGKIDLSLSSRGTSGERAGERGFLNFPAINFPARFSAAVFRTVFYISGFGCGSAALGA